jgi:hypothetical protein
MAYFVPSVLLAGQSKFNEKFLSGEWRMPDSVAIRAASLAEIANPMLSQIRTREDRTITAYFPVKQSAITGTARAAAHTGARGDSSSENLSWSTYSEPFSISIKQADNNVFSFAEMFAATQRNALINLVGRLDAAFVASLVADKSGVNSGGGMGAFDAADDVYENPLSEANYLFQNIKDSMWFNNYRGELIVVADSRAFSLAQRLRAQGSANATNYGFQFDGMNVLGTTRTVLGTSYGGSAVAFENGLVAVVPWIPKQNRKALDPEKAMTYIGDYGQIFLPDLPNVPFAIHAYSSRADNGSYGGYTQDVTMYFEISIDLAYVSAPLSTSTASPVLAFGHLTA